MRIPLLVSPGQGLSSNISSQEAINFFVEQAPPGEMLQAAMVPTHGASLFDTLANNGSIRGMLYDPGDSLLYVVSGNTLYSVSSSAVETSRDTLSTSTGKVAMALNPQAREILTVTGSGAYHYNIATTTATDIADVDFPTTATTVGYINGRFLVNDLNFSGRFWWSDLNDGTSWNGFSFATAESIDSPIRKILISRNEIVLFGDTHSELWFNSGDSSVFTKFELLEAGIVAADTAVIFDNTIAWLSQSERGQLQVVVAGETYQPQVISTPQLSYTWEQYTTVSDAFAYAYQFEGHEFYVLTFPTANKTWAYDATTQLWHQRSGPFSSNVPTREYYNCHAYTKWNGGTHIAGDYRANGRLYAFSPSVFTINSENMERRLTGPTISKDNEARLRFSEVQVDIEEGVIQASDAGNDRQITLSWSKDKGHTYSTGTQLDIGEGASNYNHRLIKRKLGYGRTWTFRVYSDTPRKLIVNGLFGRIFGEDLDGLVTKQRSN